MYNIKKEQELQSHQSHQSHLLQNIRNTTVIADQSYNQSLIESYGDQLGGQLGGQLYQESLHQLDTHHLSHQVTHGW